MNLNQQLNLLCLLQTLLLLLQKTDTTPSGLVNNKTRPRPAHLTEHPVTHAEEKFAKKTRRRRQNQQNRPMFPSSRDETVLRPSLAR